MTQNAVATSPDPHSRREQSASAALRLEGVRYAWPGQVQGLAIDRLELARGQSLFVGGPSGVGKSTLLGLLSGVLLPDAGACWVLGEPLHQRSARARDAFRGEHLGVIFQQFNLLPYLSLWDNVLLPTRLYASRAKAAERLAGSARAQAESLLSGLGLAATLWQQPAHRLSVGQQQRAAVARALMGDPALVLADEPTSALDEVNRQAFLEVLLRLGRSQSASVVMVSHDHRMAQHFDQQLWLGDASGKSVQGAFTS